MIPLIQPLTSSGIAEYFAKEYYAENEASDESRWSGEGAKALGLEGEVTQEALLRIAMGMHPKTGEPLVEGAGKDRRVGYDVNMSPDKTVALMRNLGSDEVRRAIDEAHLEAVERAQKKAEEFVFVRKQENGVRTLQKGKLIWAGFGHGQNRNGEPFKHEHKLLMNMAQREDGKWVAIEASAMIRMKMVAGEYYQAELAESLRRRGLGTVMKERQAEGTKENYSVCVFDGITEAEQSVFSTRTREVREKTKELIAEHNAQETEKALTDPTHIARLIEGDYDSRLAKRAARLTRGDKNELAMEDAIDGWKKDAQQMGMQPELWEKISRENVQERKDTAQVIEEFTPKLDEFLKDHAQRNSIINEVDFSKFVSKELAGEGLDGNGIDEAFKHFTSQESTLMMQTDHTDTNGLKSFVSYHAFKREERIKEIIESGLKKDLTVSSSSIEKGMKSVENESDGKITMKGTDQEAALRHILETPGQFKMVKGPAGAGKSTMCKAAKIALDSTGRRSFGCALAGKAAEGLQKSSGIESKTIDMMLIELDNGRLELKASDVIFIDEAATVNSALLGRVLEHIDKAGCKLVAVGDEKQLNAIGAASTFAEICEQTGHGKLETIHRQKADSVDLKAANLQREGKAEEVLKLFEEDGRLHTFEAEKDMKVAMADAWMKSEKPAMEKLALAELRFDVRGLNQIIRSKRVEAGQILEGIGVEINGIDEKTRTQNFSRGDVVLFLENAKRSHHILSEDNKIVKPQNGQLATVLSVEKLENGSVDMKVQMEGKEGPVVTVNTTLYPRIDLGMARTVWKSQGDTRLDVFSLVDERVTQNSAYVAWSRQKEDCQVFCMKDKLDDIKKNASRSQYSPTALSQLSQSSKNSFKQVLIDERIKENEAKIEAENVDFKRRRDEKREPGRLVAFNDKQKADEQARLEAEKAAEKAIIEANKAIEQARVDAQRVAEQAAAKQAEQVKAEQAVAKAVIKPRGLGMGRGR